ncbi:MAG: hypothetical protein HYW91_00815 [Candidatus Sungbacteria bacterium]|nr:hypothetical protein [Candidatus Sungbacteria bacterium]
MRKLTVLFCLVAMVATGCGPYTKAAAPLLIMQSDGKVLEAVSVVTTDPFGHDLTVQRGRECEVAEKDEAGSPTKTKACSQAYVEKQGGPNIGQVAVDSLIDAAAVVGGAHVLGVSMPKTGKTTVQGSSASATASPTVKATSGAQSTGALTGAGSSATLNVQAP